MRLVQLKVRGFRGFLNETVLDIGEQLTAIVGANDAGKSSLLEALAIFFEEMPLDQDDRCVHTDARDLSIAAVFDEPPAALLDEHLARRDGRLEVVKKWKVASKAPKAAVFVRAHLPISKHSEGLFQLKNADLMRISPAVNARFGSA